MKKTIMLLAIAVITLCSFKPLKSGEIKVTTTQTSDTTAVAQTTCPCHPLGDWYYYNCPCTHYDVYGNRIHAYDICSMLVPCVHTCVCY